MIDVGTKIMLRSSAKRYHGGPAVIVALPMERSNRDSRYLVRREGKLTKGSKREVRVHRGEFDVII